jgi:hypothetical protein
MSDIYLQITETPTVVTLSAPVISGAFTSTVTVANTVTVALDANSLSALENVTVTVGAAITGTVTVGNSVTISSLPAISGTVTANGIASNEGELVPDKAVWMAYNNDNALQGVGNSTPLPISGTVTIGSALPAGTNRIGVVTIGGGTVTIGAGTAQIGSVTASNLTSALAVYGGGNSDISVNIRSVGGQAFGQGQTWVPVAISEGSLPPGTNRIGVVTIGGGPVTIGAGTAQIGSVTASISGTVPISISSVTVGNSVTIGSLPAISGTVTANTFALQGTAVTTSNFTSTTASTVLAFFNATREVLTIFNEGAGLLFVCPGALCTTTAYQVRLSSGDYYEVPNHQTTITHSAVFATSGTARVTEVS